MDVAYMVVMPSHGKHAEQVNGQAQGTDKQKLACVHLRRMHPTMMISSICYIRGMLLTVFQWLRKR